MKKYNSVDIIFHFDVNANTPTEARKQADEQLRMGAVGCSICNSDEDKNILETSIPEEVLNNLRTKNPVLQELANITGMCIYDNNSLERAIENIIPSKRKEKIEELKKLRDESKDASYVMGIDAALDILEIYY